jgi:hypothetical protein
VAFDVMDEAYWWDGPPGTVTGGANDPMGPMSCSFEARRSRRPFGGGPRLWDEGVHRARVVGIPGR